MKTLKQSWQQPQLVVLARSRPEEAVLTNCKTNVYGSPSKGAQTQFTRCRSYYIVFCGNPACSTSVTS